MNIRISCLLLVVAALLCVPMVALSQSKNTSTDLELNGIAIHLGPNWKTHQRITVDGVAFTNFSSLYAMRPASGGRYYGYEDDPRLVNDSEITTSPSGAVVARMPLRAPRGEFIGEQLLKLHPNRRVELQVDARLTSGLAGGLDHMIGGIYTGWLQGQEIEVLEGSRTGKIQLPMNDVFTGPDVTTIVETLKRARLTTPIGVVEIETTSPYPISLIDWRNNPFHFNQGLWWVGITERPLPADAQVKYAISFKFPEKQPREREPQELVIRNALRHTAHAYTPAAEADVIVPTPKACQWGDGVLPLDQQEFEKLFSSSSNSLPLNEGKVELKLSANATHGFEEYRIQIGNTVVVEGATTAGLANAMKTLKQLQRFVEKGKPPGLRRAIIHDWPSLEFRSVHFYGGAGGGANQQKMIREVLGPLKMNAVVYQCEGMRWASHPEIRKTESGMKKEEARKVVEEGHRQQVELVPLINTFGHSGWLLDNDNYRHLADNPKNPFAYNPLKKEIYGVVHDIFEEAIELFQPKHFHIGHDEITLKGFPQDPELQRIGARKLFQDDITHYRDWFAQRGIRTMIWADMFIGPGEGPDFTLAPTQVEAKLRREGLPKDVIMCDWHYIATEPEKYNSLAVLNDAGFDTLASTWYHPLNISNFSRAAIEAEKLARVVGHTTTRAERKGRSLGILQTTWAGGNLTEKTVLQNADQTGGYVLAAEASWTGGAQKPDELPYSWRQEFVRRWNSDFLPATAAPGWYVNLGDAVNRQTRVPSAKRPHWLPAVDGIDPRGIVLRSQFNAGAALPDSVVVNLDTTATMVAFTVRASSGGPPDQPIAISTITYRDGSKETIDWKIGHNVVGLNDPRSLPQAMHVRNAGGNAEGDDVQNAYVWRNPKKAAVLKRIETKSTMNGPGLILQGITGIHDTR